MDDYIFHIDNNWYDLRKLSKLNEDQIMMYEEPYRMYLLCFYGYIDRLKEQNYTIEDLNRYINEEEEKQYQLKKERKTNDTYKNNKQNIVRLAESAEQLDTALDYIRENPRVKLMGLSTKGNLIFKEGINEVKITKNGRMI